MTKQDTGEDVETRQLAQVLKEFAGEIMKHSTRDMGCLIRSKDLSMPQVGALMYLQRRETASISEISDYLNLSLAATSHLVERLVASRFVTRAEDPNDRRLKQVTLTAEGGAMVEEVKQTRVEETAKRLATMSLPLRQALLDSMEQAVGYLRTTDALNGESNKAR